MSIVAVLTTAPEKVLNDYSKLMNLLKYKDYLSKDKKTILKLNLSWTLHFPACSTAPWQLEGVLRTLRDDGYTDLVAVENQTVVTHPWKGAYYSKRLPVLAKYGVEFQSLTEVEWIHYKPKPEMLAMYDIFDEILIPKIFIESNIIHLPTVKTHGHTTTTGAMKDAFGGLIPKYRHYAHKKIHNILVDLLSLQKEIHSGVFAVMDGTVCGNGAGPRTMKPFTGNIILASEDQVAIDAISAKIMGFQASEIDYIRTANSRGLGVGDVNQIKIVGMEKEYIENLNFNFIVRKSLVIKWDQILRKGTANMKWLHSLLFHSPLFKTFIFASEFYHDRVWYPLIGRKEIKLFLQTDWGRLFDKYECGQFLQYTEVTDWDPY